MAAFDEGVLAAALGLQPYDNPYSFDKVMPFGGLPEYIAMGWEEKRYFWLKGWSSITRAEHLEPDDPPPENWLNP